MPSHNAVDKRENRGRLVGITEIAEYAHVTRARAGHLVKKPGFPDYYEHMAMGTCWERDAAFRALDAMGYPKPESERPRPRTRKTEDA